MFIQRMEIFRGALPVSGPVYVLVLLILFIGPALVLFNEARKNVAARKQPRGMRRLGLLARSNMADQYDATYSQATDDNSTKIKALYVFPIKSCAPVEMHRARLLATGFAHDRVFCFAEQISGRDADGRIDAAAPRVWTMRSQRDYPLMSQVSCEIWVPRHDARPNDPLVQSGGCLIVTFPKPGRASLLERLSTRLAELDWAAVPRHRFTVPLQPTPEQTRRLALPERDFRMFSARARGLDVSRVAGVAAALPLLKRALGVPADHAFALLRCEAKHERNTRDNLADSALLGGRSARHAYTDQQPLNLNSVASVQDIAARMPRDWPSDAPGSARGLNALRFRANIWVAGAPPYAEETWKRVRLFPAGAANSDAEDVPTLSIVSRTSRCLLPNVDPSNGKRGAGQPSGTLNAYRRVDPGMPEARCLGMQCVPEAGVHEDEDEEVYVTVGDGVHVLQRGEHALVPPGRGPKAAA